MPTGSDTSSSSVAEVQMLSVDVVAKILNVSRAYVAALADSGALGVVARIGGGRRRISATAVEAYCVQQRSISCNALAELAAISQGAKLYDSDTR